MRPFSFPSRIFKSPSRPPVPRSSLIKDPVKHNCIVQNFFNHCSKGRLQQAVICLDLLAQKGIRLDSKALAFLLLRCGDFKDLRIGKWVHLHLKVTGLKHPDTFLANHLIDMYGKCGDHNEARKVFDKMTSRNLYSWNNMLKGYVKKLMVKPARTLFDKMPERDVVSWNTMVIAYAKSGQLDEALRFYKELRQSGIGFNEFSLAGIVMTCVKLKELMLTKQVHCQMLVAGFSLNVVLSSSIVDAYARCGVLSDARRLFDQMGTRDVLAWTTLVSGYAKWGDMESARALFDKMPERNPVSWTSVVSGYARNNMGYEALELFTEMMRRHIKTDQFTFSSSLCACASIASLKHGKQIHAHLIRIGFKPNPIVVSSLVDMYSKCGCLELAKRVFDVVDDKQDVILWNTIISAFAQHGSGDKSIGLFTEMVEAGIRPDRVTFLVLLSACSHSGLVNEGLSFLKSMNHDYNVAPDREHYACLIDMLGRAGRFDEAVGQLRNMPCKPDDRVWNALIGACMIQGNSDLGRIAAKHILELDPQSPTLYVLLSSINATLGKWESVSKLRQLMNERQIRKEQALSWLEIDHNLHQITVSDQLLNSVEPNPGVQLVAHQSGVS
ncbi:OLC1v1006034C1 [Oldenlandia corymbosa var. corymbosa]|uniref:OLC1v1006034C1 n=1 Tax=Oldenlandia corymbosa var. corymbosa TaxID=529605 RepID=A0AAV1DGJ0_OLDCO|nr:OLC1v1006034C1 [Oldenlandia corymbosa var. corymbosa]